MELHTKAKREKGAVGCGIPDVKKKKEFDGEEEQEVKIGRGMKKDGKCCNRFDETKLKARGRKL